MMAMLKSVRREVGLLNLRWSGDDDRWMAIFLKWHLAEFKWYQKKKPKVQSVTDYKSMWSTGSNWHINSDKLKMLKMKNEKSKGDVGSITSISLYLYNYFFSATLLLLLMMKVKCRAETAGKVKKKQQRSCGDKNVDDWSEGACRWISFISLGP